MWAGAAQHCDRRCGRGGDCAPSRAALLPRRRSGDVFCHDFGLVAAVMQIGLDLAHSVLQVGRQHVVGAIVLEKDVEGLLVAALRLGPLPQRNVHVALQLERLCTRQRTLLVLRLAREAAFLRVTGAHAGV
eukprot:366363-Chlamydomonas_euryale.AAC.12